jgi:hypothetical protein
MLLHVLGAGAIEVSGCIIFVAAFRRVLKILKWNNFF